MRSLHPREVENLARRVDDLSVRALAGAGQLRFFKEGAVTPSEAHEAQSDFEFYRNQLARCRKEASAHDPAHPELPLENSRTFDAD